jgi:hypothetical protein
MSLLDFELRLWIARYLAGEVSLGEFRHWLLPHAWILGEPGEPDSRLIRRTELWLAEYMNGHRTEDELRQLFSGVAPATSGWPAEAIVSGPVATGVESAFATP